MEHADNRVENNGKARQEDIWARRKLPTGSYDFAGNGAASRDDAPAATPILDGIGRQVKQHPGRVFLFVTGLGLLIGRVLRRR